MTNLSQYIASQVQSKEESSTPLSSLTCQCCRTTSVISEHYDIAKPTTTPYPAPELRLATVTSQEFLCSSCESMRELSSPKSPSSNPVTDQLDQVNLPVHELGSSSVQIPVFVGKFFRTGRKICRHVNNFAGRRFLTCLFIFMYCLSDATAMYWRSPHNNGEAVEIDRICQWAGEGGYFPQSMMCKKKPKLIAEIQEGLKTAVELCKKEFKLERWNCSQEPKSYFENLMREDTKQKAYIQAMTAASIVHSVTKACRDGVLEDCQCRDFHPANKEFLLLEANKRNTTLTSDELDHLAEKLHLKECSDKIDYGILQSQRFLSARKRGRAMRSSMSEIDRQNFNAGRQLVKGGMTKACVCHGISGACTIKSCYDRIPTMLEIGKKIREQYDAAVCIAGGAKFGRGRCGRGGCNKRKRVRECRSVATTTPPTRRGSTPPPLVKIDDIVYKHASSNFCRRSSRRGVLGTRGRVCDPSLPRFQKGSCKTLCCNRGYQLVKYESMVKCNCTVSQHAWGVVQCQQCPQTTTEARCN